MTFPIDRDLRFAEIDFRPNYDYMNPAKNNMNYESAFSELQQIITDLEDGEIGVDELAEKVKRAASLIDMCKAKLTSTEEDVEKILQTLEAKKQ